MSDIEDRNDLDWEATPRRFMTPGRSWPTRREWMAAVASNGSWLKLKPPTYWLKQQDEKGREKAKFMIWHNRYDHARRISVWAAAPIEDYEAAGYLA